MHEALTTATNTVPFTNGHTDTPAWPQTHDYDGEAPLENWQPNDYQPLRRPPSAGIQKLSYQSTMSSLADAAPSNSDGPGANSRWRFNNNGQLVDSEAESAEWDLADEIVRLKIGEVAGDAAEDIPIRTPPKSKLASAQLADTSPLDTASIPSVNSSPLASDHIGASHSRGSSTDTTVSSSQDSVASNTMVPPAPVRLDAANDVKERPHSFSGGLSSADLRRLQQVGGDPSGAETQEAPFQQQWASIQFRDGDKQFAPEQPAYPSLAAHGAAVHRPQQGPHPQLYDYRTGAPQSAPNRDDLQIDYNIQQRNFNPLPQGSNGAAPAFIPGRPNNAVPGMPYRQPPPRGFPQQGLLPSPTALGYPGVHAPHLSLGNSQQLYEMMLPGHENHHPAVARVQQQHNAFRGAHHHSTSDPSALRDAATLALLNSNMQAFANNMYPGGMAPPPTGMPMYPNQFYAAQEAYGRPDVATAQAMAARLQAQYTGPYAGMPQTMGMTDGSLSPGSTNGQGPSANNRKLGLYKTELCRSWEEKGTCRYAGKCQFAHGEDELRNVSRHPKYKTEICRTFWVSGSCPYGKRCCFIHTELPPSGGAGEAIPPPPDGRARSLSTNSDPNEGSVSLLARIAKREPNNAPTPTEASPSSGFQFTRPPTGSLRVDTSVEASLKQNKSAYPSFASNGVLIHAAERLTAKSPAPVTAGPDLGRHNNSRLEIVGYNQRTTKAPTPSNSSVRHSFNGSDGDVNFSPSPPASGHSPFTMPSAESTSNAGRTNGHVRAGSAGNWGSFSRSSHLTAAYGQSSPSTEAAANSPWSTTELAVGSSRLHEKAWA
ncbi:hypothetical protein C8F04DRAFT_1076464 [Mycena alexandri]|uniref:C3H1-type domain-containing protein n=1 Tax=Mycena alexandri TaxID=1745969 RepID=A0AAD6XER7_9AGAR|nr:hypothetical protein C8F04DRAFT_1076464 [Mycena alexandri]